MHAFLAIPAGTIALPLPAAGGESKMHVLLAFSMCCDDMLCLGSGSHLCAAGIPGRKRTD